MAVQQNKTTRSKRGMRRAHEALYKYIISVDKASGETHIRHNITKEGFYRGRKIINKNI